MQSFSKVIYFGPLIFILIALCDGNVESSNERRHSTGVGISNREKTHAEYVHSKVVTGGEGSVNGLAEVSSENAAEDSRRFPSHTTHIGKTRQGRKMTVRTWYLDRNGKPSVRTSDGLSLSDVTKQSSSHTTRLRQRGVYPGKYVRGRTQSNSGVSSSRSGVSSARSGVSSTRSGVSSSRSGVSSTRNGVSSARSGLTSARRSAIHRRRSYVPRRRGTLNGRSNPSVHSVPVQNSKTYVYPFTEKYPQGEIITPSEKSDNNRRSRTNPERDSVTGGRIPFVSSHRPSSYYPQNNGRRGSETQALSSGVETQRQTASSSHLQPNLGESSVKPDSTLLQRETPFSSNSSVTHSLNRQSTTQRRLWGRVRDPSRFNPRANPGRTFTETSPRQSYRQTGGYRRTTQNQSKYNPTSQIYNPSGPNAYTTNSRGTKYYPSLPNAQKPQVQRTFRRNRVSTGYSSYSGSYPQQNPYQGGSTESLFNSYDVVDDGECPNTGIDLRINGLGCRQAVQSYGQYLCYLHEYTSKECCETCLQKKRSEDIGCEYGDHARLCNNISPSDCYDRRNEMSCCKTCAQFKKVGAPDICQWGDMIGSERCEEVRRNPGLCYMPDNARLCCETCSHVKNINNPSCPWGDQNARMCQIFGPKGDVLINCYSPYRRRLCCESCERLKQWLPSNMPRNCEYGDRPVVFNTGQFGRVNCAQLLKYVSVNECRDNPIISTNCCYTCQRYLNSTSTTAF